MEILEADLSREALKLFEAEYKIFTEVPLYNRCIDAVLLKESQVVTIEFKIKNWRKAVRQIKTHMLAADLAYLCMPRKKIPDELLEILTKMGVGLWLFDMGKKELCLVLRPRPSFIQLSIIKEELLKRLSSREEKSEYSQTLD